MEINEITHQVIGCAMKVHNTLGNGFPEITYQRALAIEMLAKGLFLKKRKICRSYTKDNT